MSTGGSGHDEHVGSPTEIASAILALPDLEERNADAWLPAGSSA